jgi:pilus assembly protein CpaB
MAERRYTLVFYIAVLVAAAATYGVYRALQASKESARVVTAQVVVAAQDIPEGHAIDKIALTTGQWPVQTLPAGAFSSVDSVVGRVTRVPVFQGEPIVPGRLAPVGTTGGLEIKIAPGKRAMSVKINDVAGISGLIQPNSRVDVLVNIKDERSEKETQVAKTATLEVTPDEAERLAIAMGQGSIALVLRGYGDPDSIKTKGATSNDVLAQLRDGKFVDLSAKRADPPRHRTAAPPPPPPPPPVIVQVAPRSPDSLTVQVYRGSTLSQNKFVKKGDSLTASKP